MGVPKSSSWVKIMTMSGQEHEPVVRVVLKPTVLLQLSSGETITIEPVGSWVK